jgi:hypothetical protein
MNRWARIVWSLALVATLGWIGVGVHGYRVADQPALHLHTLGAFVALLALVLAHGWMAIFALVSRGLVARAAGVPPRALAAACRATLVAGTLAVAIALAQFALSSALYPERFTARAHALAAGASLIALVGALAFEARALAVHAREVAALERAPEAC